MRSPTDSTFYLNASNKCAAHWTGFFVFDFFGSGGEPGVTQGQGLRELDIEAIRLSQILNSAGILLRCPWHILSPPLAPASRRQPGGFSHRMAQRLFRCRASLRTRSRGSLVRRRLRCVSWPRNGRRQIALAARVICAGDGLRDGGDGCFAPEKYPFGTTVTVYRALALANWFPGPMYLR